MVAQRRDDEGRDELRRLVDDLPASEIPAAKRMLGYLRDVSRDPVLYAALHAPIDDEPWTEEDEKAVQESEEDIRQGRVYSLEEVRRELGI